MSESGADSSNEIVSFEVPKQTKDLKACQNCGIILTQEQWKNQRQCLNGCSNNTTKQFQGMVCIMKPSKSWVVKKLGHSKNIQPGLYAIDVQAD